MISKKMFAVNTDFPNTTGVVIRPDMIFFGNDSFTLTLEWPQLVMLYNVNTQYNMTVIATPCGNRSTANININV